ncbi:MAG: ABC transporter permease [Bacteroidetes bacterium]|nr:MAG: ABC transporter permease [Bacteroidota bacterium]
MFEKDNWHEIYVVLSKNKIRTALTAFGVFWGIYMLLVMMGAGSGLRHGVMDNFSSRATNSMFLWAQRTTIPYKGFPQGRSYYFNNDDTQAMLDNIPEIKYIAPRGQLGGYRGGNNVFRGLKSGAFSVNGDMPDFFKINPFKILNGRLINENDIKDYRKVAAIGKRVYDVLFTPGENPIGQAIQINGVYFTVVGVFDNLHSGNGDNEESQTIFIPFSTFQRAFNWGNVVAWYSITSTKEVPVSVVEEKVLKLLAERHSISPKDTQAFGHWNMEKEFKKIQSLFSGISALIWIVGLGTLIAGVIGVSNIMLVTVKERTKEFGIKRALGATPFSIILQIIMESILLTSIAGILGLIFGVFTVEGINMLMQGSDGGMFRNPEVDLNIAIKTIIIMIVAGGFAGFLPANRAVRIRPIDALRTE